MAIAEIIIPTTGSLVGVIVGSMTTYWATDKDRKIKRKEEVLNKLTEINYAIADMKETFNNEELEKSSERIAIAAEEQFGQLNRRTRSMSSLIDRITLGLETIGSLSNLHAELKRDVEAAVNGTYQYEEMVTEEFSRYGMAGLVSPKGGTLKSYTEVLHELLPPHSTDIDNIDDADMLENAVSIFRTRVIESTSAQMRHLSRAISR
ncbi:hypothetical protein ACT3SZ_14955 [Corynebacterium sp. AOP40-9SA-29]|uniref:hypothetical protein n=1 Tax=Corynebacterium sp. AOP40-9SA-29 TaxID=3457677 RepID=UPI0040335689